MENNVHKYRVCGKGSFGHEKSPIITIHGKWLNDYGFDIGDYIECRCEDGKLVIKRLEFEDEAGEDK